MSQIKYMKEMLKKFNMEDNKPVNTPMITSYKLSKDENSDSVDHTLYRSMIGSLLYLTATHPDILQAVCMLQGFKLIPDKHM